MVEAKYVLNRLNGSKVFSKVDLKDVYLQIPSGQFSFALKIINNFSIQLQITFIWFKLCSSHISGSVE